MSNISPATAKLIEQYRLWHRSLQPKDGVATINVDDVTSKVATFYEKIREIVDWREKHLMRRMAIERILKRRLFLRTNSKGSSEPFVFELIRGGHFPNDEIPKTKIAEIQKLIDKYTYIINKSPAPPKGMNRGQLYVFLISVAACEVEETLDPLFHMKETALIEYMEESIKNKLKLGEKVLSRGLIDDAEKNIQIYIAVQQALLKLDSPIISYYLLKRYYPSWINYKAAELTNTTKNIYRIWDRIEKSFEHPLSDKFYKICERYDTPYLLLGDILSNDPINNGDGLADPAAAEKLFQEVYGKRFKTLKSRLGKTAFFSTLSIFVSNIFTLYALEFPFAKYVIGNISYYAAIFDILGPTFLMFLLMVTIRPPGKKNLPLVFKEFEKIVYGTKKKEIYEVELYPKRSVVFRIVIYFIYFVSFCVSFGVIIWCLWLLNYPPLSYLLLIMFTSLIAFSGLKIRQRSRELDVTEQKGTIFNIIIDPLSLPMVRLGKWLTARWKKINIVGVIFILLVDTPFLVFVEFLEQWRYFIKEKKEDIR
jgi:hypothetical protein